MKIDRKQTKIWTTRDGTRIRICDMENSHLLNTIKMLHRNTEQKVSALITSGYQALGSLQGEMAIMSVANGLDNLEREGLDPYEEFPILNNLEKDASRRGIYEEY